ncbi:hypothetical protein PAMA_011245 [Pampus argenteus]
MTRAVSVHITVSWFQNTKLQQLFIETTAEVVKHVVGTLYRTVEMDDYCPDSSVETDPSCRDLPWVGPLGQDHQSGTENLESLERQLKQSKPDVALK